MLGGGRNRRHKSSGPGGEGATLIGVGDDWQAIFGFQGGDASLIRTPADPAGVVRTLREPLTLVNGYRFGQGLARVVCGRGKSYANYNQPGKPESSAGRAASEYVVCTESALRPD